MKYFKNISTPEELKKQFRQYCITMHPDKGGNAAEFAHMFAEYRQAAKHKGWSIGSVSQCKARKVISIP